MSKPGADPSSGTSLGDALRLPKRHPACRRREAQSGSCMERENLTGDAKGKGASGSNREAESTDAPERGGLPRSSGRTGPVATQQDLPEFDLLDPGEFGKRSMSEMHVERKRLMAARKSAMDGTRFPL